MVNVAFIQPIYLKIGDEICFGLRFDGYVIPGIACRTRLEEFAFIDQAPQTNIQCLAAYAKMRRKLATARTAAVLNVFDDCFRS